MSRILLTCLLFCTSLTAIAGAATDGDIGRADTAIDYRWGVKIPLRDGVKLNATVYRPADWQGKLPAIVTITPYISDRYQPDAKYFARHGYAFLVVDSRGRGNSEGDFQPMSADDGRDGHDVIEWIARQPWSDGQVAMRGGSYGGYNQWATVRHQPAHLRTIVPIAAAHPGIDFPMNYNVPYPYSIRWLTLTSGRTANNRTFGDEALWRRKFLAYHTEGIAFAELDQLVGNHHPVFKQWVDHPQYDDYYAAAVPSADQYRDINLPTLTITGYYDGDQPGAMHYYRQHLANAPASARDQHYLLLGPWDHSGTRIPRQSFGGMTFGDAMMFDAWGLDKDWYDWIMRDGQRPDMLKDRVTYYVAGNNEWKSAPALDAIADEYRTYYLDSDGEAGSVYHSGHLRGDRPQQQSADQYVYDPLDTRKASRPVDSDQYIIDQSEIINTHGDGLIYHSQPFDEDTEISGFLRFEAWLEMDVPDTDINVTLYEIKADGSSIALSGETQRARYRQGLDKEQLIEAGEINQFVFERFYFFSRLISQGSRLRLFIRPANGLNQQRNYNSGKAVNYETRNDARTATIRLHHGADHPSRLIVPVVHTKTTTSATHNN
ncbi:MAG: CocE/NonD family hydrolase [Wenzhouxiangellaceae bacterium]